MGSDDPEADFKPEETDITPLHSPIYISGEATSVNLGLDKKLTDEPPNTKKKKSTLPGPLEMML